MEGEGGGGCQSVRALAEGREGGARAGRGREKRNSGRDGGNRSAGHLASQAQHLQLEAIGPGLFGGGRGRRALRLAPVTLG